jgi:hypothetical protein
VVVYDKFTQKELFSFVLHHDKAANPNIRARIYEIGIRHDLMVIACGSFSFVVKIDPAIESAKDQDSTCVVS